MSWLPVRYENPGKPRKSSKRKKMAASRPRRRKSSMAASRPTRRTATRTANPRKRRAVKRKATTTRKRRANPRRVAASTKRRANPRRKVVRRRRKSTMRASAPRRRVTRVANPASRRRRRPVTARRRNPKFDIQSILMTSALLGAGLFVGDRIKAPLENFLTNTLNLPANMLGWAKVVIGIAAIAGGEYANDKNLVKGVDIRAVGYGLGGAFMLDGFEEIRTGTPAAGYLPSQALNGYSRRTNPSLLTGVAASDYAGAMQGRRVVRRAPRQMAGYYPALPPAGMSGPGVNVNQFVGAMQGRGATLN